MMYKVTLLAYGWLCLALLARAQEQTITYEESFDNIANPERGMWIVAYAAEGQDARFPLSAQYLANQRAQHGRTLVHCRYVIDEFRNAPLSEEFLAQFDNDLQACRTAGVSMVPLFMYNHGNAYGEGLDDAPQFRVMEHLDQLKPIVQANIDLIAYWPGGFVGRWGEGHNSSNNLYGDCRGDISAGGKEIINKIFEISAPRAVVFRSVFAMKSMIGTDPLPTEEAFSGTIRSRAGFKNHFFMGFDNSAEGWCIVTRQNGNCVWECSQATIESEKNFINAQCKYTPVEIEPDTSVDPKTDPRHAGSEAIKELKLHRASSCNPVYNGSILNRWKADGVYEEIERNLGYRFQLIQGTFPNTVAAGTTLEASLMIRNVGYASPYNPRGCELVLRQGDKVIELSTNLDPRFWLPEDGDAERSFSVALPDDLAPGEYEVLVNLPALSSLRDDPRHSIRLANEDVWEAETGYNKLNTTVTVIEGSRSPVAELADGVYEVVLAPERGAPRRLLTTTSQQGNGDNVFLGSEGSPSSQRWQITQLANGFYRLSPQADLTQSLDVRKFGTTAGANVQTWRTNRKGQANQEWKFVLEDAAKGYYSLSPRHAEEQGVAMRLDASVFSVGEGKPNVQLGKAGGSAARRFVLERVNDTQRGRELSKRGRSVREEGATSSELLVYPNPASSEGFIVRGVGEGSVLRLYDLQGKRVPIQLEVLDAQRWRVFPESALPKGMYMLKGQDATGTTRQQKLVVE